MHDLAGVPLTHLFVLRCSVMADGITCFKSSVILTKDGAISVNQLDDLFPFNPDDSVTTVQLPQSLALARTGLKLILSYDRNNFDYDLLEYMNEELREMCVVVSRMVFTRVGRSWHDTVEIKQFASFVASLERTKL